VAWLIKSDKRKLEGERQPTRERAALAHVGVLDDRAIDSLEEGLEMLFANEA
jgi:hypothetical protein